MTVHDRQTHRFQPVRRLPMPECHAEDYCAFVVPCEVALVVEIATLHLVVAHAKVKDLVVLEGNPVVAREKTQTHVTFEILHLET